MNLYQAIDEPSITSNNHSVKSSKSNYPNFPSRRLFRIAVIAYKKLTKIPKEEHTRTQELHLLWAAAVYDFGRKKFAELLATEFWLKNPREDEERGTSRMSKSLFPCFSHLKRAIHYCRRNLEFPESQLTEDDRRNFPWAKGVLDLSPALIAEVLSSTDKPAGNLPKAKVAPTKANVKPSTTNTKQIPVLISDAKTKTKPGVGGVKAQQVTSSHTITHPPSQMPNRWNQFSCAANSFPTPYMYNNAPQSFPYTDVHTSMGMPMTTPMSNFQMPHMYGSNSLNAPNYDVPANMSNFPNMSTYDTPAVPYWNSYTSNEKMFSTSYNASDVYKSNTPAELMLVPCKTSLVATVRPTKSFNSRRNLEDFVNPTNPLVNEKSTAKRRRLTEEEADSRDDIPEDLIVGLVDRNNVDGEIKPAHWDTIKTKIMPLFREVLRLKSKLNDYRIVELRSAHEDRIKLFGFDSHRTLELFKNTLKLMGRLWPDANITIMPKKLLPRRPRYRAFIPAEPSDPETIMAIIKVSNPTLPTYNWKVVNMNEESKGQRVIGIATNEESFAPLLDQDMTINYAFGFTRLKMYKDDRVPSENAAITAKFSRHNEKNINQRVLTPQSPRDRSERDTYGSREDIDDDRTKEDNFALLTKTILDELNKMAEKSSKNYFDPEDYKGWF